MPVVSLVRKLAPWLTAKPSSLFSKHFKEGGGYASLLSKEDFQNSFSEESRFVIAPKFPEATDIAFVCFECLSLPCSSEDSSAVASNPLPE